MIPEIDFGVYLQLNCVYCVNHGKGDCEIFGLNEHETEINVIVGFFKALEPVWELKTRMFC